MLDQQTNNDGLIATRKAIELGHLPSPCDYCHEAKTLFVLREAGARYHLCKECYLETAKAMVEAIEREVKALESATEKPYRESDYYGVDEYRAGGDK